MQQKLGRGGYEQRDSVDRLYVEMYCLSWTGSKRRRRTEHVSGSGFSSRRRQRKDEQKQKSRSRSRSDTHCFSVVLRFLPSQNYEIEDACPAAKYCSMSSGSDSDTASTTPDQIHSRLCT
eukprot:scaffold517_cov140-Skeletonema_marinoi.AAC.6